VKIISFYPLAFLTFLSVAAAQTFEINGQPPQPAQRGPAKSAQQAPVKKDQKGPKPTPSNGQTGLSWGTSIDVSRQARAAEQAIKSGDYATAAAFAEKAANAAPQNSHLWFMYGYAARLSGKYGQSIDAYNRGLKVDPRAVEGISGLAQTYARMGRFDEAKRLLDQLIALDPKRSNDLTMAGELALQSGDYQRAADFLHRSENIKPDARNELLLASAYMKLKQPARAKQYLQVAVAREPRNPQVQRALAAFYRENRQYEQAAAILKKIADGKPDLLAELAYTYELAKDNKNTAAYYQKAADAAPKNITYQLSAAQALVRLPDYKKADSYLNRARAIDPNHYRLHSTLGEIARSENRAQDAINEYKLALANVPDPAPEGPLFQPQLRMNMVELLKESGDDAAAKEQARLGLDRINNIQVEAGQRFDYYRLRGSLNFNVGDWQQAETDVKQALAIDPENPNAHLQYGQLLWRMERRPEARREYESALKLEANNRFALSSLGFLAREMNDAKAAEGYFQRLAKAYPDDYTPYLALGDLYTAQRNFGPAQTNYERAYKLNAKHPMIIAGGANAGIESKKFNLAKAWLDRADDRINQHPYVMRERERYLTWTGNYLESAKLGYQVIQKLPKDRDAAVYLGYDLLYLGRYDDLLRLTSKYEAILPKEAAVPLLAGYVQRKSELLDEAEQAFSRAIERDPKVTTAYINRGFVYNDLQNPEAAAKDFSQALKLEPKNGEAHLGLAFAYLQLRKPNLVLENTEKAAAILGESKSTHLARAGGYRQKLLLPRAEGEYRAALKIEPDDTELNTALAQTLFGERKYAESIAQYKQILPLVDDPSSIYANMATAAARLKRSDEAMQYIAAAERSGGDQAGVLLATGDALLELKHDEAAMERYKRALTAPDSSRVDVRLAFARNFLQQGKWDDARQQVALAFAESRVGESTPVLPEHLVEAANIFASMYDFDLSRRYYEMARNAGADDRPVAIGLANTYLAQGMYKDAEQALRTVGTYEENVNDYDYMMAYGSLNRQRRTNDMAIMGFARAHELSSEDEVAERALLDVAGEEGRPIGKGFRLSSDTRLGGIFEDATVYTLDAKMLGVSSGAGLPAPRSSLEWLTRNDFKYRWNNLPLVMTYQLRNARGLTSFPSLGVILDRNTYDNTFGFGVAPMLRIGRAGFSFNPSIDFTIRRDRNVPQDLDQNLFRQQVYMQSTPLFNWLTIKAYGSHESGPFIRRDFSSRDLVGNLDFIVGRPWGHNAIVTGYHVRDTQLDPVQREYFTTSSYAGYQRAWGRDRALKTTFIGEYIRSWRIQDGFYALAQAMRPAVQAEWQGARWGFDGYFAWTRGQGSHIYDNAQSSFFVSYTKPWKYRTWDGAGEVGVEYPLKFSLGISQQSFFNFTGDQRSKFVPVIRLTFF
jgi:tetratricopeptide (TPR) repeat protein